MRAKRLLVFAALLAAAPIDAHAEDGWRFEPKSGADAVRIQANAIYPANLVTARLSYLDKDDGGSVAALSVVPQIAMPYALVPGVSVAKMYSIVRLEMPVVATATAPMMSRVTGIGDLQFIDAAIKSWEGLLAAGAGVTGRFPTATRDLLGLGQLAVGPITGVSADFGAKKQWSGLLRLENLTSVAGTDDRPGINVLTVRPRGIYYFDAAYVAVEPHFLFNWKRDGEPTVLVTARAGFAANTGLVFVIEPAWVAVGTGKNDVSVTLIASYVGW